MTPPPTAFPRSLAAWGTPAFEDVLKEELRSLGAAVLPLQQGLVHGSVGNDADLGATLLRAEDTGDRLQVRAGLFYTSVIAGCNCADDPTPVEENAEYCEVRLDIDKASGLATIAPAPD